MLFARNAHCVRWTGDQEKAGSEQCRDRELTYRSAEVSRCSLHPCLRPRMRRRIAMLLPARAGKRPGTLLDIANRQVSFGVPLELQRVAHCELACVVGCVQLCNALYVILCLTISRNAPAPLH